METIGIVAVVTLIGIWRGFVLMWLWGWFVAQTFHVTTINVPQALGISVLVAMLTHEYVENKQPDWPEAVVRGLTFPTIGLALGWIYHLFL